MSETTCRPLVFVINDDTAFLDLMEQLIRDDGYEPECLKTSVGAFEKIKARRPEAIVLDIRINNEESGLLLLDLITLDPETRQIPVIVASANLNALAGRQQELAEKGIYLMAKPFDIDDLSALLRRAIAGREATGR
jgi:two-component system phosphate regulon response regulator PhoB